MSFNYTKNPRKNCLKIRKTTNFDDWMDTELEVTEEEFFEQLVFTLHQKMPPNFRVKWIGGIKI